jgi:hypothetical protein
MKTNGGVEVQLHHSWTRQLMEVSDQLSFPDCFAPSPRKEPPGIQIAVIYI